MKLETKLRVANNMAVFKNGRSTGPTAGLVFAVNPSVNITYESIVAEDGRRHTVSGKALVVTTRAEGWKDFARVGDSGSLVMDHHARAIGVLTSVNPLYNSTYVTPWEAIKKDMMEALAEAGRTVKELELL